jgi:hypothetical protein
MLLLRRQDGAFVDAFSAWGATSEAIVQAAQQDYEGLLQENAGRLAVATGGRRSA